MLGLRTVLQLLVVTGLSGCASQPRPSDAVPADPGAACEMSPATPDGATWREVKTDRFSFCVPAEWRSSGQRSWRGEGGTITWGLGERVAPYVVASVPGQMPSEMRESIETIGGARAELHIYRVGSTYRTSADWTAARVNFSGEARSYDVAQRHLAVYRTVRLATSNDDRRK